MFSIRKYTRKPVGNISGRETLLLFIEHVNHPHSLGVYFPILLIYLFVFCVVVAVALTLQFMGLWCSKSIISIFKIEAILLSRIFCRKKSKTRNVAFDL